MLRIVTFLMATIYMGALPAQQPGTYDELPEPTRQLIEDVVQNQGGEGDFDFNAFFDELSFYLEHPLDINSAPEEELRELRLLSDLQIQALLQYRRELGDLISIHELQSIRGYDLLTIRAIQPYVQVGGDLDDYQVSIPKMLTEGRNDIYLRWVRLLERQKGFIPQPDDGPTPYRGDPNQYYIRYRHAYSNRMSYGLTAEKDRGEELFKGSNKQGFDFYSAHVYLRNYSRRWKAIALGDYTVSLGQGLILFNGFTAGKSVAATSIKRTGRTIRPYTSVNEANFFRGAALSYAPVDNMEVSLFVSRRGRDGNLLEPDTLDVDNDIRAVSSLDMDGLHRTEAEIADRNVNVQNSFGGKLSYGRGSWKLSLNALYDRFDKTFSPRLRPDNQFQFRGDELLNLSADYSWAYRNLNFFGEVAYSDNGAIAQLHGLLIGLDRKLDVALMYRDFPRDYQALNADPFAETSGGRNERGFYIGLEARPAAHWKFGGYFDAWTHHWLRFQVDAPSRGYEYRMRLTYWQKRKLDIYIELRDEKKQDNLYYTGSAVNRLTIRRLFQGRLHIANKLTKALELRSRLDVGFSETNPEDRSWGIVVYQDVLFKPIGFPLSFTARYALMDTESFRTRFYSYENDLLLSFSVPPYYNRGHRWYLNLRYKGIRNMTIEARIAQLHWTNVNAIGSGLEQINGPSRTQVRAQIKYSFGR